jgi:hypothetical protein
MGKRRRFFMNTHLESALANETSDRKKLIFSGGSSTDFQVETGNLDEIDAQFPQRRASKKQMVFRPYKSRQTLSSIGRTTGYCNFGPV